MLKFFATDVSVSKGYDGSPALRFSESDGVSRVRFRVGKRVYDSRCENNHRYINLRVKASGDLCERIRKMKLKEGSFINISGRYDEETIKDDETGKEKTYPIIILDEATSALDNDTEAAIMESINRLHGRKTLIIIAHRLQTIEKCDIVYRVEDGRAKIERGNL